MPTTVKRARPASVVAGEYPMTEHDFRRIAAMLDADSGIVLHEGKAALVYSRLAKRLRALGLRSFAQYCDRVGAPGQAAERRAMVAELTTNFTRFFREPHHFEHLRAAVLPRLMAAVRRGERARIWSAAASSGQEAYSIALTALAAMPEAAEYDFRILATDIDQHMVAAGQDGVFGARSAAEVPEELRRRWFATVPGEAGAIRAGEALRRLVSFREMNLIGDWPMQGRFDAIFCRNVVIYFDEATQNRLWARMVQLLEPGGVLYLGHSERVSGAAAGMLRPDGVTIYRRAAECGA